MAGELMDLSIAINEHVPNAKYQGSTNNNNEKAFNKIIWLDDRPKPTWAELEFAWESYNPVKVYTAQEIREMFTDDEMKAVMIKAKEDINVELILMKLNTRISPIAEDSKSLVVAVTYLQSLNLAPQALIDAVLK